jgi:2-polyprenyl-6-methoxyphenol hydroxylase-like FAD-dependent oxidoreductase
MAERYDAVVVGGSLAGCAAARFLAQRGARVALVERRPSPDAYKVACTHYIQAGAAGAIERLGLAPLIAQAGGVPNKVDIWTRYGWIRAPDNGRHGWNLRRSVLDPMLRRLAADTPGVTYLPGVTATGLGGDRHRIDRVHVRDGSGAERTLAARVVVAADGRDSAVARIARVAARVRPHGRIGYFAYHEGVELPDPRRSMMWLSDPDVAYLFANEHGIVGVTVMPARAKLETFRADPGAAVYAHFRGLQDAPDLSRAKRVGKWIGRIDMPNTIRPAAARGVAFVGDAAQSSDPVWGVGCGWAFQSAEWLAQEAGAALHGSDEDLARALDAYRVRHRRELAGHHWVTSDYSSGRPLNPMERLMFAGAARDEPVAEALEEVGTRSAGPFAPMPWMLARSARALALT